ncbi:MAG: DNA polymerase III subunit alpha [Armatimonadetes bacterium]|nr:DNA polymerase III subunit alpha [Armatimonadota bacterium]
MTEFVHLHCHTEYSLLDGCNRIPDMVARAVELGMPALSMTDHGVMYGTVQFYKACKKAGIKPLIGCEVYVAPRGLTDRDPRLDSRPYHFTLLAQNDRGYRNLLKLVSKAHLEGYYYKPRVDRELLACHSEGIVALSGCLRGEVNCALLEGDIELARRRLGELRDIYRDNLFVELMDHGLPEQKKTNIDLIRLARDMKLPLVATNDAHYGTREDAPVQDTLVCIQTGKMLDDPARMRFFAPEFYLKTGDEMARCFGELPDALSNTLAVAERCNLELDLSTVYLPNCPVPEGHTPETYLHHLCQEGLIRLYGTSNPGQEYLERLETELQVINGKGFAPYFLIIWDFIKYAREHDIPVGPGRGSAAGSLVAYLTGITKLDPLKHGLLFERFLNPERTELPDVDTDFCVERREEVIRYCRDRYGHDKVAQIITFGRMKARAAIRDVGRVMDVPLPKVDKIAKTVPEGPKITLKDALESPEFRQLYSSDAETRKLVDLALKVEGMARNAGIHAAGVVMSSQPISNIVPLQKMNGDEVVAQFDMNDVAQVGLVKMDFLGLRNLTVINHCLKIIRESRGESLDLETIETEASRCPKAAAAYQLLADADTTGVFQLESEGMKRYLRQLKPDKFSDIVAFLALYRPGPLQGGIVDEYIRRRHGKGGPVTYPHDSLESILNETYGFFLYQEQVMLTANILAGYSMAMADELRKAMGKKKAEVMAKHRQIFVDGAVERGVNRKTAAEIFETMEKFAAYGFNKSHSAAYAVVSYQTAYLKANYRKEYMAALLTSVMSTIDKVSFFIRECQQADIEVLAPDINESRSGFTVVPAGIRWGLAAVRNVGVGAVENLIELREKEGKFKDLADLCARVDLRQVNKRVLEGLIKSGGLDSFGETRATLIEYLDACLEHGQWAQREAQTGQFVLFESLTPSNTSFREIACKTPPEFPKRTLLDMEREMLGVYLSDSPLTEVSEVLKRSTTHRVADLKFDDAGKQVTVGGMVTSMRKILTRFKTSMAFLQLEDFSGSIEVSVRPQTYEKVSSLLDEGLLILVRGKVEVRQRQGGSEVEEDIPSEEVKLQAEDVLSLERLADTGRDQNGKGAKPGVHIRVQLFQSDSLPQLRNLLLKYRGGQNVFLHLSSPQGETVMQLSETFTVRPSDEFARDVRSLLGQEALWAEAS